MGYGKANTVATGTQLKDSLENEFIPTFYPSQEDLGSLPEEHEQYYEDKLKHLVEPNPQGNPGQQIEVNVVQPIGYNEPVTLRKGDIHNSIAEIYAIAVEGDKQAVEHLILISIIAPNLVPDWVNPLELLIQSELKDSEHYLYALINTSRLDEALTIAEEKYMEGDFNAGKHLALFLLHDARFLNDQNPIHFSTWGVEMDKERALNILFDMCLKEHKPACNLANEKLVQS